MASVESRDSRSELDERSEIVQQLLATRRAKDAIKKWDREKIEAFAEIYSHEDEPLQFTAPKNYESTREATAALIKKKQMIQAARAEAKQSTKITPSDLVDLLRNTVAFSASGRDDDSRTLLTYDYDNNVYTYSDSILREYITHIMGSVTNTLIQNVADSLLGYWRELVKFEPLPNYKIAVGNGVFNCLTNELEPADPRYVVTEKITTNYSKNSYNPHSDIGRGRTFAKLTSQLANHEPDRIQLLQQICKAIITGHSVAPAMFIVMGRGGDGKSTFFQLMVNVVGENNTAFVNFDEIKSDDKMAETIGKKFVLGMDNNVNEYIKKTALLKSMSSHEYLTHSRKYERAKSVKFSATFVQLCNEMPRFIETGDSMRRRIVCFHAENSHYKLGTEDKTITSLIETQEFREHALSAILDESQTGFYSDFNDIDRELIEASLDNEDILAQFIKEMDSVGLFNEKSKRIPVSHLYAAYRDWMKGTSPNSSPLSSLSFSQRISKLMDELGYEQSQVLDNVKPSSLENADLYSSKMFSNYFDGEEFKRAVEADAGSRVFELTHERRERVTRRRGARKCSSLEFFGVFNEFLEWLSEEDKALYEALDDPMNKYSLIDDSISPKPRRAIKRTRGTESTEAKRKREERDRERDAEIRLSNTLKPPMDIRAVANYDIDQWVKEYEAWVDEISSITPETANQEVLIRSTLDQMSSLGMQLMSQYGDPEFHDYAAKMRSHDLKEAFTGLRRFIQLLAEAQRNELSRV